MIYTAKDKAHELGFRTWREALEKQILKFPLGKDFADSPVYARVDFSRWLADCECGGASYVDYNDNFFICTRCGNSAHGWKLRPVIFPENRAEIEYELMLRPVELPKGMTPINQAMNPVKCKLSRSWTPPETVEALKKQREAVYGV